MRRLESGGPQEQTDLEVGRLIHQLAKHDKKKHTLTALARTGTPLEPRQLYDLEIATVERERTIQNILEHRSAALDEGRRIPGLSLSLHQLQVDNYPHNEFPHHNPDIDSANKFMLRYHNRQTGSHLTFRSRIDTLIDVASVSDTPSVTRLFKEPECIIPENGTLSIARAIFELKRARKKMDFLRKMGDEASHAEAERLNRAKETRAARIFSIFADERISKDWHLSVTIGINANGLPERVRGFLDKANGFGVDAYAIAEGAPLSMLTYALILSDKPHVTTEVRDLRRKSVRQATEI